MILVNLEDKDLRRLKTLFKLSDSVFIFAIDNELTFLVEIGNFFKSVSFDVVIKEETFLKVSSDLLLCAMTRTGILTIDSDGENVFIGQATTAVKCLANDFNAISHGSVKTLTRQEVLEYLKLLKASKTTELSLSSLDGIKNLIKACSVTESGIQINDGYAFSLSDNIIVFSEMMDKSMKVGLSVSALKEIDKFKTAGVLTTQSQNFMLLRRESFVLGLVKAVVKDKITDIVPESYLNNETALATYKIDLSVVDSLQNISKASKKAEGECDVIINLANGTMLTNICDKKFLFKINVECIKKNIQTLGKQELKIPLNTIDKIKPIVALDKDVEIAVYPTNTRIISKKDNMNLIIRSCFS